MARRLALNIALCALGCFADNGTWFYPVRCDEPVPVLAAEYSTADGLRIASWARRRRDHRHAPSYRRPDKSHAAHEVLVSTRIPSFPFRALRGGGKGNGKASNSVTRTPSTSALRNTRICIQTMDR